MVYYVPIGGTGQAKMFLKTPDERKEGKEA
jgi:hypothetical protein